MSSFSNLSGSDAVASGAYVEAILGLLGDRSPLDVLASTPDRLSALVDEIPHEHLSLPEAQGKWSIAEVLQHLADSEIVWAFRLRTVLSQDRPLLSGYDQDLWARRFRYEDVPVSEAMSVFSACRMSNLRLLTTLSAEDYEREGVHSERGVESVGRMVALYAGHDLVHIGQIERIRDRHVSSASTDDPLVRESDS